jgi:HSP20 family protein
MVRIYYRSVFDELNDMRAYMDALFRQMGEPVAGTALLPAAGEQRQMLPALRGDMKVDVKEQGDEVVVTADMPAGIAKKDISIDLVNPKALEVSCERNEENEDLREGYFMQERVFGSMNRIVPLPKAVTEDGAKASFKNGVLEVHLKKRTKEPITTIMIE